MRLLARLGLFASAALMFAGPSHARVVRVVIDSVRPAPNAGGPIDYEIVSGTFFGEVDPKDLRNSIIVDIEHAPKNSSGKVEYSATFAMSRPVDAAKASGVLFYDVPNRGWGTVAPDPNGHVRVISGWQGDIAPAPSTQSAVVPVAKGLTGGVMARFDSVEGLPLSVPIVTGFGRPSPRPLPVSLDTKRAKLMIEERGKAPRFLKSNEWAFANCRQTPFPGKPDGTQLCLKGGFDPNTAYTLGYTGKDPQVLGLGFAMTRDLVAFLRSGKADDAGNPNPAGGGVRWTVGAGNSQSGNFLRTFLNLGFNQAETGERVFDGINSNIAARQLVMNVRFAVPGSGARLWEPGSEGTLWWGRYHDRMRGHGISSLLDRCTASSTCPKIIETLGSAEFWNLRASPDFVGTDAKADIPLPANVRRYYFPGVSHGGARRGGFPLSGEPNAPGCVLPGNPNPISETHRVAIHMLVDWVRSGKEPLPSQYPSLANGELVEPTAKAMGWPARGILPTPDGRFYAFHDYDFGRAFDARQVSGVTQKQPPRLRRILPSRVPRVNQDGNETSGVPSVQHLVPIGTYTGWNIMEKGFGAGGGCVLAGGFIPFAINKSVREAKGDMRLSLEERYGDHKGFVAKVRVAVAEQQAAGWLLADDAKRLVAEAEASDVLKGVAPE